MERDIVEAILYASDRLDTVVLTDTTLSRGVSRARWPHQQQRPAVPAVTVVASAIEGGGTAQPAWTSPHLSRVGLGVAHHQEHGDVDRVSGSVIW
ncbi:MAG: hypothetical protein M3N37_00285 [Actinomycetota bacterium]|nr:hypothetical protein [Actinomycetota bacterium]